MRSRAPSSAAALSAVFLALSASASPAPSDDANGFVLVKTIAGVSLKLDGKPCGVTEGDEGLVIRDVAPGPHRIDAWMTGFEDQHALAMVEAGRVERIELSPWQPIPEHRALELPPGAVEPKTGALIAEVMQGRGTIDSKALGWKKIPIERAPFVAAHVLAGKHKLTFCNAEKCMDYRAEVRDGAVTAVIVDFGPGRIYDVSARRRTESATQHEACEKSSDKKSCVQACKSDLQLDADKPSHACESLAR